MQTSASAVRALTLAFLVAAACSSSKDEPGTPTGLVATQGGFDSVTLQWASPRSLDLEIEMRVGTGEWKAQPYRVPASAAFLGVPLAPDLPEMTWLAFRARNVRGDEASAWSTEATVLRGVRPASDLALDERHDSLGYVLSLSWTRRSLVADGVRLERQIRPDGGPPGPWVEIPIAPDATAYADVNPPGLVDFGRCAYRVTYLAGELASIPAETESSPISLAAPRDVLAAATGPDVHVTWVNASTAATRIDVWRYRAGSFAQRTWTLPPDATSVDDNGLEPGLYVYGVQAVASVLSGYLSEVSRAAVVIPSATHAYTYPGRPLLLPKGNGVARQSDGSFAVAQGVGFVSTYASYVYAPEGSTWDRFATPGGADLAVPGPLLDTAGGVHAFYLEELWNGASGAPVRHVWRDGAGWHAEYVGLHPWGGSPSSAIAADGSLHVAWTLADGTGFAYATDRGGSFAVEEVRPAGASTISFATPLALDADGAPVVAVEVLGATPHHRWVSRAGGAWASEVIPEDAGAPPEAGWRGNLVAGVGYAGWIYGRWTGMGWELWLRERRSAAWAPAQQLATTTSLPAAGIGAALSPDGSRLAVALPGDYRVATPARLVVFAGGAATETALLPSYDVPQVGFTPGGKLWVLDGLLEASRTGDYGVGAYVLYEEP